MKSLTVLTILMLFPALAAAATFDFTLGAHRTVTTASMASDGIILDIGGSDGAGAAFDVSIGGGRGLGVAGTGDTDAWASQIEGWGDSFEVLSLSFDRQVRIESITFTWADFDDRIGLAGAAAAQTFKLDPSGLLQLGGDLWTGTQFSITPESWTFCAWFSGGEVCEERHSGFRIASIEVSDATSVVPLPASVLLLLGGLAGLVLLGRDARRDLSGGR